MDKLLYDEKMAKLTAIGRAIDAARELLWDKPSYSRAVALNNLKKQRDELRASFPKPRLVA